MIEIIIHKKNESTEDIISYSISSISLDSNNRLVATKDQTGFYYELERLIGCDVQGSTSYEICARISNTLQVMKECDKFYQFRDKDKLLEKLMEILF